MTDWRGLAACRDVDDPEIFTVAALNDAMGQRRNYRARQLCATCPVLVECREYAIATRSVGVIFGGRADHTKTRNGRPAPVPQQKHCPVCEAEFWVKHPIQKYCTPRCTEAAEQRRWADRQRVQRAERRASRCEVASLPQPAVSGPAAADPHVAGPRTPDMARKAA